MFEIEFLLLRGVHNLQKLGKKAYGFNRGMNCR